MNNAPQGINRLQIPDDWRWQLQNRITRFTELPQALQQSITDSLSSLRECLQDKKYRNSFSRHSPAFSRSGLIDAQPSGGIKPANMFQPETQVFPFPMSITPYLLGLFDPANAFDPILRQFIPEAGELLYKEYELTDPLSEDCYSPVPKLIHRYPDRALVLATNTCASFCRFCFRRSYTSRPAQSITAGELKEIAVYISGHQEIQEIILSGGDPLTLENDQLYAILNTLKEARKDLFFRIGTRVPVVMPQRLEPALIDILAGFQPLWIVTHINHSRELQPSTQAGVERLIEAGIPVLNQTVLLRGINNDVRTLDTLFHTLARHRIKPYYLFQGDLALGTFHYRTSLNQGLELMENLKYHISGLVRPTYAVDLPGGGGKVALTPCRVKRTKKWYKLKDGAGRTYRYPVED